MKTKKARTSKELERKGPKKVNVELSPEAIDLGGKFLAISNYGWSYKKFETEREFRDWYRINLMREADGGADEKGVIAEVKYWRNELIKKNPYCVELVVKNLPFLFQQ